MKKYLALVALIGVTLAVAAQQSTNTVDKATVQDAIAVQSAQIAVVDAQIAGAQAMQNARLAIEQAQFEANQARYVAQKNKMARDKAKLQAALTNAPVIVPSPSSVTPTQ